LYFCSIIDMLYSGIAFAQILHACCPDQIPLYKLNFDAITKAQALGNLLILDEALRSAGLYKSVQCTQKVLLDDINNMILGQKIAAGSALENYHFLNWCWGFMTNKCNHVRKTYRSCIAYKRFFDIHCQFSNNILRAVEWRNAFQGSKFHT